MKKKNLKITLSLKKRTIANFKINHIKGGSYELCTHTQGLDITCINTEPSGTIINVPHSEVVNCTIDDTVMNEPDTSSIVGTPTPL